MSQKHSSAFPGGPPKTPRLTTISLSAPCLLHLKWANSGMMTGHGCQLRKAGCFFAPAQSADVGSQARSRTRRGARPRTHAEHGAAPPAGRRPGGRPRRQGCARGVKVCRGARAARRIWRGPPIMARPALYGALQGAHKAGGANLARRAEYGVVARGPAQTALMQAPRRAAQTALMRAGSALGLA